MKSNFKLIDNYAISFNGHFIDLHNNFDFVKMARNTEKNTVSLFWKKSSGKWASKSTINKVELHIIGVNYFNEISGSNSKDKDTLMDATYYPKSLRSENDTVTSSQEPQEDDDVIFKFEDGRIIRLNGALIEASIDQA